MKSSMSRKAAPVFLLISILSLLSCGGRIVIASYNVENLFDDRDQGREYPEYSAEQWSRELYNRKLSAVARAVKAAVARGPDILCFQEIESELALRDLRDRHLKGFGYRYLVFVPQEQVATTVACLSRIPVARTRVHTVGSFDGVPLRHILELQVEFGGSTLYLFNNHWKSKTGGVEQTAGARRQAAEVLTARLREILQSDPEADLLVVGDLNENLEEYEQAEGRYRTATVTDPTSGNQVDAAETEALFITPNPEQAGFHGERVVLYEPWYEMPPDQRGSSVYQGRWQTPDRILLSPGLFDREGFVCSPGSFQVVRAEFLIDPQSGFPRPWRHSGRGADSGTSDHLPLRLTIRTR
jgi:endonuclease/exonuclease/phosphatase family metal-dependent hydrolase